MQERLVDLELHVQGETDKAYQVSDGVKSVWVHKCYVKYNKNGIITLPELVALDKGFI